MLHRCTVCADERDDYDKSGELFANLSDEQTLYLCGQSWWFPHIKTKIDGKERTGTMLRIGDVITAEGSFICYSCMKTWIEKC